VLDLNLRTPLLALQLALPALAASGGVVVNVASTAGLDTTPYHSPEYGAAKAGLVPRERMWDVVMAAVPQVVEDRFDLEVVRRTEELGQSLAVRPESDRTIPRGFWGGIDLGVTTSDGTLTGGRTPFSGGTVEGI
jgi:hypothetical protein